MPKSNNSRNTFPVLIEDLWSACYLFASWNR
jgi:hypothetical protein